MDSVFEMIQNAASVFLFIIAISFFLLINNSLNDLLITTKNNINNSSVLYEQQKELSDNQDRVVNYEDLIGYLMKDITTDIKINNIEIVAESYDYLQFDFSVIPKTAYKVTYERDNNGNITKIIYSSTT